ncbi:MAG: hypothetical protein JSS96_08445 [Bacteroidetes bacterium]|nr:hypothetical protein [Bacteroidota bacterium]
MKKTLLLFMLFCIALSSCTKDDNKSNQPTTYRIDNITDQQIGYSAGSVAYLQLSVGYVGPIQENVSLSLSGLPAGVTADTNSHSGIPSYSTVFYLMNDGTAKPGTYTVTLNCKGDKTGNKSYTFKIKVLPPPQCTSTVAGTWAIGTDCLGNTFSDNIEVDPSTYNRIIFSNFADLSLSVYADLDCNTGTFTIPRQGFAGHVYYGNGYFSSGYIQYSYVDSSAAGINSCYVYLRH